VAHRPFAPRPAAHIGDEIGHGGARHEGGAILVDDERVGVERADRRGFDRHRAPVGAELVGHDLREQRRDALTHFALRDDRADMPVVADLQKGVEDMLIAGGGQVRLIVAWPQRPGDRKAARRGGADQNLAAADVRQAPFVCPHFVPDARHARC
jgi:hypothetical protein